MNKEMKSVDRCEFRDPRYPVSMICGSVAHKTAEHEQVYREMCDPDALKAEGNRLLEAGDVDGAIGAFVHAGFITAELERGWPHICQRVAERKR
jgi:hypothetical protein